MIGAYKNEIKPEYQENRDQLQSSFVQAYEFINWLENLEKKGFHLGTDINMHFYYQDSFLLRLVFKSPIHIEILEKSLMGRVKDGTVDRGNIFFSYWFNHLRLAFPTIKYSNKVAISIKDNPELYFKSLRNAVLNFPGELKRKGFS